jgi:hypothetical protein
MVDATGSLNIACCDITFPELGPTSGLCRQQRVIVSRLLVVNQTVNSALRDLLIYILTDTRPELSFQVQLLALEFELID